MRIDLILSLDLAEIRAFEKHLHGGGVLVPAEARDFIHGKDHILGVIAKAKAILKECGEVD